MASTLIEAKQCGKCRQDMQQHDLICQDCKNQQLNRALTLFFVSMGFIFILLLLSYVYFAACSSTSFQHLHLCMQ